MKKKSFEQSICELEQIVTKLENGDLTLEESVDFFQKGVELSKHCSKTLDEIEKKITMLVEDEEGNLHEEALVEESKQ